MSNITINGFGRASASANDGILFQVGTTSIGINKSISISVGAANNDYIPTLGKVNDLVNDKQTASDALSSIASLTYVSDSFIKMNAQDTYEVRTLAEVKTDLSLDNVTNESKATMFTSPTFTVSANLYYATASELLATNGSKNIVSLSVTTYPSLTELSYVKGVTSAIQTQIDTKLNKAFSSYSEKTTPVDADKFIGNDTADSSNPKWFSWANIKATLKTYFDTLYEKVVNKVTSLSGASTDTEYPSAKLLYDQLALKGEVLTNGLLNGLSVERQELSLRVSGTSVYLDVQAIDGGDIDYKIDGTWHTLDCTTGSGAGGKATIELPQGSSTNPLLSVVYVTYDSQSSSLIMVRTSHETMPIEDYAPVAIIAIKDYTTITDITDATIAQRTTETITRDGRGMPAWLLEKLRAPAQYDSGIDQSLDITTNAGSEDDINFTTTSGVVFQANRQQLGSVDVSTDGVVVVNASGDGTLTNFQELTNLNEIHEIADGTALVDGDCINLVIIGSVNYGGINKLLVTLPTGKYTDSADAIADGDNTAVTNAPSIYKSTGYLVAKLVLKYTTANNGTWENLLTTVTETWHSASQTWTTPNYPSNYPSSYADYLATLTEVGAEALRVVFSDFNTEANYDFIKLRNAAETDIHSYDGNLGAFTSDSVTGDTIKVYFSSDGTVQRKGVQSLEYEYLTTATSGQAVVSLLGIPLGFNLGASGGMPTPDADKITTDTSNFNNNLSSADTDVQKALETLDDVSVDSDQNILTNRIFN